MQTIRRILVPVDFSPCSRAALRQAASIGERFGASLDVMHAWQPPRYAIGPDPVVRSRDARRQCVAERIHDRAAGQMTALLASVERPGVEIRCVLEMGDPLRSILDVAVADESDLIVMGTHAKHRFLHSLVGGISESVVRRARCPVLIVRERLEGRPMAQPAQAQAR